MTEDLQEQRIWAQTLLENGRFTEAVDIYQKLASVSPNQTDLSNLTIALAWKEREFAQRLLGWMPGDIEIRRFFLNTLMRNAFHKDVEGYCSEWIPTAEEPFLTWLRLTRIDAEVRGKSVEPHWDEDVTELLSVHGEKAFLRREISSRLALIRCASAAPHLEKLSNNHNVDEMLHSQIRAKILELKAIEAT